MGPRIIDGLSNCEETPMHIKQAVEAELRDSKFEMLESLESSTRCMKLPTRNQQLMDL
jgi:hypothetical protein